MAGEECLIVLLRSNGTSLPVPACDARNLRAVLLAGLVAIALLFASVVLLFLSLCCTVCKMRQMKRILSHKEPDSCGNDNQEEERSRHCEHLDSCQISPPISLNAERPPLILPPSRLNSRTDSLLHAAPAPAPSSGGTADVTKLETVGVYSFLSQEDEDLFNANNRLANRNNSSCSKLNLESDYSQVCESPVPMGVTSNRRSSRGSRSSASKPPVLYFSDLLRRERGSSQAEDDLKLYRIVEL